MTRWNDARRGGTPRRALGAAATLLCAGAARAQSVTVAVDRNSFVPLAANFSGTDIASPDTPVEFGDPAVQAFVRPPRPVVPRWPGGTVNDVFVWRTGPIPAPAGSATSRTRPGVTTPIDILRGVFSPYPAISFNKEVARATDRPRPILAGKGGNPLGDRGTGFATALSARLVVVVNATTDTVEAAERQGADQTLVELVVGGGQAVATPVSVDTLAPANGDPAQENTASSRPVAVAHVTVRGPVAIPGHSATHLVLAGP